MAVTSLFEGNLTKPKTNKPLGTLSSQPEGGLFGNLQQGQTEDKGIGELATEGVRSMLTGDAYDAYKQQKTQNLARSIANLRRSVGGQFGPRVGQSAYDRAQQRTEQGIFSELASQNLAADVEKQAMRERGITAATGLAQAEQASRLQDLASGREEAGFYGYKDPVTGQQIRGTQALEGERVDIAREQAQAQKELGLAQIASTEKIAKGKLDFDYDSLSQQDRQELARLGFDREQFNEAKRQYDETTALQDKIQTRDLNIREQELAQQGAQFDSRLEFDQWATQAGLDDAAAERIWKAGQNDKALAANLEIQTMLNNTDRWKQERSEQLTREGWDAESIENYLDREQQSTLAELQSALTREIEQGRLTQQQAELVETARQFDDRLAWEQYAKSFDINEAEAQRAWATNERLGAEAHDRAQSTFQSQLQKELATGTWVNDAGETVNSMDAKRLIESARQYDDQADWIREAKAMDISENDAQRTWQAKENVENRQFQKELSRLGGELARQNISFQATMDYLGTLSPEDAWDTIQAMALDSGMTHVERDADGNIINDPMTGLPKTKAGFPPLKSNVSQDGYNTIVDLEQGVIEPTELKNGMAENSPNYEKFQNLLNSADVYEPETNVQIIKSLNTHYGEPDKKKMRISNMPESQSIVRYGDQVFQVESSSNLKRRFGEGAMDSDEFTAVDLNTGKKWLFRMNEDGELYNTQLDK